MTDTDIELVASMMLAHSVGEIQWAEYPELGEHDFNAAVRRCHELAKPPDSHLFVRAYNRLAARAEANTDD